MLRDKDMLRSGLRELDNKQLGSVLALVLSALDDRSDKTLSQIIQELGARMREMEEVERLEVIQVLDELDKSKKDNDKNKEAR